jgi:hypothetical protein
MDYALGLGRLFLEGHNGASREDIYDTTQDKIPRVSDAAPAVQLALEVTHRQRAHYKWMSNAVCTSLGAHSLVYYWWTIWESTLYQGRTE